MFPSPKKKNLKFLFLWIFYFLPTGVLAQNTAGPEALNLLKNTGGAAGYNPNTNAETFSATVGTIIYSFLGLLGVIFLALIVYAGFLWLTAGGDETKVKDAQKYMKNAVIGLIIVLASLGITAFILYMVGGANLLS